MKDDRCMKMISDLVNEIDYDIWKGLFVESCIEDPELAEERRTNLLKIVKKYL